MQRRELLSRALLLGASTALPAWAGAAGAPALRLVAAWADAAGRQHLGVLRAREAALQVVRSIEIPGRAHGLLIEPGGTVLAAARRPGDWVLRWSPSTGQAQWFACASDRSFTGHLLRDPAGACLYSAETDLDSGQGLIAVRDARTFELREEWATHGIDPHQFILDADGSLLVANGGVPTRPETGRAKVDLERMDPSLVRLDSRNGALLGQWRLPDPRLSIRHLARHADGHLGVALQAEHDDAQAKATAPVLAIFDGAMLRTAAMPQPLAGYGGDIAATAAGFMVSVPRAGGVARWARDGSWAGFTPLAEACSLATMAGEVWAGGRSQVAACGEAAEPQRRAIAALRLDNHWVAWPAS
jgi:uncharacterized protein